VPLTYDPIEASQRLIRSGFEGAIVKRITSPYLAGVRSAEWFKIKKDKEVDAIIIAAELGEGRLATTLGALTVEDIKGNVFRVGGGFTDADRHHLWQLHQENALLGLAVAIKYQPDKKIKGRFPRFSRLRDDLDPATLGIGK
jgi:DNA ligase-1